MAGEKKIEESQQVVSGLKSDSSAKLPEKDMAPGKDGVPSVESSVDNSTSGNTGEIDQAPVAEQGVYYPPTSYYNYYYPAYNGSVAQLDDQAYYTTGAGSYNSGNGSILYYMPGYSPYATGYVGGDYAGDVVNGNAAKTGNVKSAVSQNGSLKSNGFNSSKTTNNLSSKNSSLPLNSKARQFDATSNLSKAAFPAQPLDSLNKLGSGYQSMGLMKGYYPVGKYSSYANQNYGAFMHYPPMNYQTNGRGWNVNNKYRPRGNFNSNGEFEASAELMRGPRANKINSPKSAENEQPGLTAQKEKYNLESFPSEYENGKFYVIKSYSEDDIHKCVKYDVWSSTPNGNKKLDSAFRDAEAKARETSSKCPVFLFFSVNGSGQFLGVAEMIGPVDFNKKMDFWQLDKWSGFFPVKWHIVKDVPNSQLRHIILENNDHKPVTYSRDTQEIGLKQGLEMLSIFKKYLEKTSILDDLSFYEDREKSLKARRNNKSASQTNDATNRSIAGKNPIEFVKTNHSDPASLTDLTKNLSLNS